MTRIYEQNSLRTYAVTDKACGSPCLQQPEGALSRNGTIDIDR